MAVDETVYLPMNQFTTVELGCEPGNNKLAFVHKIKEKESTKMFMDGFNALWNDSVESKNVTEEVIASIEEAYKENSPRYMYFFTLYNIFSEFLEDISEDNMPNELTGFKDSVIWNKLYNFQKDAAIGIINKLEKYNGCILADSVGLGKTFTAISVIKYYENRNKSVLVLCPKKLSSNWNTYKNNYKTNPLLGDRLRYDVLYHTDLSRERGISNGIDLSLINWQNYDLLVIDESHNFRNGGLYSGEDKKENRYLKLMNKVIKQGVKTKVLMLSATPVNNRFLDLKNQIALAYEGDAREIDNKLKTKRTIDDIFKSAQATFNEWSKQELSARTTESLQRKLDFDFFEVLDSVTIARSRKHIQRYYETSKIGEFPERLKPISVRAKLTSLPKAINYKEIFEQLNGLMLTIYTPSKYIHGSKQEKYIELTHNKGGGLTQSGREEGIRRLMNINLLKRLESSVYSFNLTINKIEAYIDETLNKIDQYKKYRGKIRLENKMDEEELDIEDANTDLLSVGKKVQINIGDMDYLTWESELKEDKENLDLLKMMINEITPSVDSKIQELKKVIDEKINNPINQDNKKIIIFTAFADTADYLYEHVSKYVKEKYNLNTAKITGSEEAKTNLPNVHKDLDTILTLFSPLSKGKDAAGLSSKGDIDILIATDCISEGQNLQDCDYLINYDIHWNPVRIIQRFGRVDRIGSKNKQIQLVNFWPDLDLDEYINLKARVETKMKISVLTSTGDDNIISPEEQGDLDYRRAQLQRLQEEVVDLEEMSEGVSIMDLGLNEYRMDLLKYIDSGINFEAMPTGLHTVVSSNDECPKGAIFILKNINNNINRDNQNRIHPFYMVYIADDYEVVIDHLSPKKILDTLSDLAKREAKPIDVLTKEFNEETADGSDMSEISELLSAGIESVIERKEESDIESLFTRGGTSALLTGIKGLDDFKLISFFVVR